jgi:protein O-mannosyl-transferase
VATRKVRKKKARSKQFKAIVPPKAGSAKIGVPFQNRHEVTKNDQLFVPGSRGINAAIFLFLIIGTVALYSSDLRLGFFRVDDQQYVVHNPWIKEVNADNIKHILTTQYFVNYSPLHLFSYMLDYAIGGSDPYTFHLSSNLWAGIVAGFVFLVALAFTKRHLIAILAAILFIVHPAHVEAIAWISSRKDLVATAFVLPSLLAYLKYRKTLSLRWYILSIVLFVFALAGKLSVATFPAVFVAIDLFMEKRTLLRSLVDKWPYMIAVVIMALIVASAQPPTGSHPDPYILAAA